MTKCLTLEVPAKVNLWLRVFGRDSKGYHAIETLFQLISVADTLSAEATPRGVTPVSYTHLTLPTICSV